MKAHFFLFVSMLYAANSSAQLTAQTNDLMPGCNPDAAAGQAVAPSDQTLIEETIKQFMRGGDESDTTLLTGVLHPQFRVVVNQGVLGSETLRVIDRPAYFKQIAAKKWGGVPRTVDIVSISIAKTVAAAEVKTSSVRSDITSFLHLVKGKDDKWTLIGDTPFPTPKKTH
jgi:Putative lumazine-binding